MWFRPTKDCPDTETFSDSHGVGASTSPAPELREFPAAEEGPAVGGLVLPQPPPSNVQPLPEVPNDAPLGRSIGLRFISGRLAPQVLTLEGPAITLGRELDNTLPIPDAKVSRHHARLELIDGAWVLSDLNSTNGIRLNGLPVTRAGLSAGDFLYMGDTVIRVEPGVQPAGVLPEHLARYDLPLRGE